MQFQYAVQLQERRPANTTGPLRSQCLIFIWDMKTSSVGHWAICQFKKGSGQLNETPAFMGKGAEVLSPTALRFKADNGPRLKLEFPTPVATLLVNYRGTAYFEDANVLLNALVIDKVPHSQSSQNSPAPLQGAIAAASLRIGAVA